MTQQGRVVIFDDGDSGALKAAVNGILQELKLTEKVVVRVYKRDWLEFATQEATEHRPSLWIVDMHQNRVEGDDNAAQHLIDRIAADDPVLSALLDKYETIQGQRLQLDGIAVLLRGRGPGSSGIYTRVSSRFTDQAEELFAYAARENCEAPREEWSIDKLGIVTVAEDEGERERNRNAIQQLRKAIVTCIGELAEIPIRYQKPPMRQLYSMVQTLRRLNGLLGLAIGIVTAVAAMIPVRQYMESHRPPALVSVMLKFRDAAAQGDSALSVFPSKDLPAGGSTFLPAENDELRFYAQTDADANHHVLLCEAGPSPMCRTSELKGRNVLNDKAASFHAGLVVLAIVSARTRQGDVRTLQEWIMEDLKNAKAPAPGVWTCEGGDVKAVTAAAPSNAPVESFCRHVAKFDNLNANDRRTLAVAFSVRQRQSSGEIKR